MKLTDIGPFLRERIEAYFRAEQVPLVMRYIDPSYLVRSTPANAEDSILCDLLRAMPRTRRWRARPA